MPSGLYTLPFFQAAIRIVYRHIGTLQALTKPVLIRLVRVFWQRPSKHANAFFHLFHPIPSQGIVLSRIREVIS